MFRVRGSYMQVFGGFRLSYEYQKFVFRVRHPTSKFIGCTQGCRMVKLAKITLLYPVIKPKNLDVKQLTLHTNPKIQILIRHPIDINIFILNRTIK